MTRFFLNAYAILLAINSFAQTDSLVLKVAEIQTNRIEYNSKTIQVSSVVLTKPELKKLPGISTNDWLSTVAGVDVRQRGPAGVQADIGIRGGSFDQTLGLINGIKLSDPQTGHHLFNLPLTNEAIDQIEIVKSPASRLYGLNAYAGSINFVTKVPNSSVYGGLYSGMYGLFGADAGIAIQHAKVGQHIAVSYAKADSISSNNDFNNKSIFYQATTKGKKSNLNVFGGYVSKKFGAAGYYVKNSKEYEELQTVFAGLAHTYKLGHFKIKTQGYYRYNQDHYVYIRTNPEIYQNFHYTHTYGAEVHVTYASKWGNTGIGFDARKETIKSTNLGDRMRNIGGVFAEHQFLLFNQKFNITPGVYINAMSSQPIRWFPGMDVGYVFKNELKLFASAGKSLRLPTYTDLYYDGPSNIGNANLVPEEALNLEIGVKKFSKRFDADLALFSRSTNNLIDWVLKDSSSQWQPQNLNQVLFTGFEANANINVNTFVHKISLRYAYINADFTPTEGVTSRYAISNIRHQLIAVLIFNYGKYVTHSITNRFVNRVSMPNYNLVDTKLMVQIKWLNVWAEVTNVFDETYNEAGYVTMPGIWAKFGIDFKLNFKDF